MTKHAHLELIALAVRNIHRVDAARRPDLLEAAAELFESGNAQERAEQCRSVAALLRNADAAQTNLAESFKPTA